MGTLKKESKDRLKNLLSIYAGRGLYGNVNSLYHDKNIQSIPYYLKVATDSTTTEYKFNCMDYDTNKPAEITTNFTSEQKEHIKWDIGDILSSKIAKPKEIKVKPFASCPTSLISGELHKKYSLDKVEKINKNTCLATSKTNSLDCGGAVGFTKILSEKEIPNIVENYISFEREELQIYLGLLNVYMQNVHQKHFGLKLPISIELSNFHKNILNRVKHLEAGDIDSYLKIFRSLSLKRVTVDTTKSTNKIYNNRKNPGIFFESNLIQVDVLGTKVNDKEYRRVVLNITPTMYTLFELLQVKQISNFFPWEFIQLKNTESDNILYFGLYLVRLHRINQTSVITNSKGKKERIKNKALKKELKLIDFVKELPGGKKLIEDFEKTNRKKEFIQRNIEKPLKKALKMYVDKKYFLQGKLEIKNYKNALSEDIEKATKVILIFNYEIEKLQSLVV